ncbi:hypothetical protein LCGC14_3085540, partial [marine sediment metagenome]
MNSINILVGDARHLPFPDGYFHTVVTSPPYWGLRDYGLKPGVWGAAECEHEWSSIVKPASSGGKHGSRLGGGTDTQYGSATHEAHTSAFCRLCNAWFGAMGFELTPELYVQHLVEIFREVKRTLRDDGT